MFNESNSCGGCDFENAQMSRVCANCFNYGLYQSKGDVCQQCYGNGQFIVHEPGIIDLIDNTQIEVYEAGFVDCPVCKR